MPLIHHRALVFTCHLWRPNKYYHKSIYFIRSTDTNICVAQLQHRGNEIHSSSIHFKHRVIIVTHLQAGVPILPMSHIAEWLWKGRFLWAYIGIGSTSNWPKAHLHSGKVIMALFGGTLNEKVVALWLNSAHRSADASRWLFYWVWYGHFVCVIIHLPDTLGIANLLATPLVSCCPFVHYNVFIASYFILQQKRNANKASLYDALTGIQNRCWHQQVVCQESSRQVFSCFFPSFSTSSLFVSKCMCKCCVEGSKGRSYSVVWHSAKVTEVKQLSVWELESAWMCPTCLFSCVNPPPFVETQLFLWTHWEMKWAFWCSSNRLGIRQ